MKSTDFFIDKANEYKTSFENILTNYVTDSSIGWDENPKYTEQQRQIADLKIKTKLLFSEFDKGEFFIHEIKKVDSNILESFDQTKRISSYNRVIDLFINHLNDFRK